jgi:hypothetical protein
MLVGEVSELILGTGVYKADEEGRLSFILRQLEGCLAFFFLQSNMLLIVP